MGGAREEVRARLPRSHRRLGPILKGIYTAMSYGHRKDLARGVWSRRLTQEHRIVYLVGADRIDFLQVRYHY
ncbi:MAG: type II toxin-antitoxin system YoeB family toxin [Candidatus Aminicenantes bacterium]|nr:type II toxin-antitoxin system YoeB family toxin [Candidatus Aminicenantes bacterium]